MKNFITAAFATAAIALLTASPVVADQSADQGAAQKPTLMSDAEMAEVVAGTGSHPFVLNSQITVLLNGQFRWQRDAELLGRLNRLRKNPLFTLRQAQDERTWD